MVGNGYHAHQKRKKIVLPMNLRKTRMKDFFRKSSQMLLIKQLKLFSIAYQSMSMCAFFYFVSFFFFFLFFVHYIRLPSVPTKVSHLLVPSRKHVNLPWRKGKTGQMSFFFFLLRARGKYRVLQLTKKR